MTFWTVSPKPVQKSPAKKSVTPKTTLAPEQVKVKESPANKPLTAPAPESMKRELPTSGLAALNELESVTMTEVKKVSPAMKKIKFCKDGAKFLKGVGKLIPLDLVGLPSISTCFQPIEVCADIADLIHQSCMGEDESGVHILVEGKDKDGKMHEYLMHDERPCCMKANKDNLGSQIAMRAYTGPEDKNPTLFKTSTTRYMLCCVGELPEKMPFCICPERTYSITDYENGTPKNVYAAKINVPPPMFKLCIPERATTSEKDAPEHVIFKFCSFGQLFGQLAKTQYLEFYDQPKRTWLPKGPMSANPTLGKKNELGCIEGVKLRLSDWCYPEYGPMPFEAEMATAMGVKDDVDNMKDNAKTAKDLKKATKGKAKYQKLVKSGSQWEVKFGPNINAKTKAAMMISALKSMRTIM